MAQMFLTTFFSTSAKLRSHLGTVTERNCVSLGVSKEVHLFKPLNMLNTVEPPETDAKHLDYI